MIRVLLAGDQAMMRGALAVLLNLEEDIELPGISGLDATAELTRALPECRVVIVTTFGRPGYLERAMAAGAAGFLVKAGSVEDLADAVRRVTDESARVHGSVPVSVTTAEGDLACSTSAPPPRR